MKSKTIESRSHRFNTSGATLFSPQAFPSLNYTGFSYPVLLQRERFSADIQGTVDSFYFFICVFHYWRLPDL